ncbi:MAG: TraR/DksA family transcriptional regulator [Deltaproteobacteria bacterium]|nr:TraR/DksA family transcriptional regulator [Deltaproteobacteria bacterium]
MEDIENERTKSATAVTDDIGDDIDHANEERSREFYQLLCERDQQKLIHIKEAIESIDSKTYGTCEDCGDKIGKARLVALPFTKLCIDCKNEEERLKGVDKSTESEVQNYAASSDDI